MLSTTLTTPFSEPRAKAQSPTALMSTASLVPPLPATQRLSFAALADLVQAELQQVEARMRGLEADHHPAVTYALDHLLVAGGKRLRPMVTMLAAGLLGAPQQPTIAVAAAIEMLHTATLVHDDLIDGALLRRGHSTLNAQWTPAATVLTGDYLFAHAASLAAQAGSVRVMEIFARALMIIVNGEVNQLFEGRNHVTRDGYFQRIYGKTAALFATAAEAPAILSGVDEAQISALRAYGQELGMAFQIMDDILDFTGEQAKLGKPVGSDLRQGLFTLPALYYIETNPNDPNIAALLNGHAGDNGLVDKVVESVRASDAIASAHQVAQAYIERAQTALSILPDNPFREALMTLADYAVSRAL